MNYAVMRTMFGDFWVGKTDLEVNGVGVFATWDEALEEALELNDSVDNQLELEQAEEEEADEIRTDMERWIV